MSNPPEPKASLPPPEDMTETEPSPPPPARARASAAESRPPQTDRFASGPGARAPRVAPRQVGRFLVLKSLGEGGMGVVYSAYDPELDRKVALKLLLVKDEGTDLERGKSRLQREAQAMARVSHPHVIPVFDVGAWEDQVFLAMELVDGGTLRDWLRASPRSWREVLEKYLAAGRGLAAAHAAGLVHRDFKPANVLVGHNGRVFVTDFGLARPFSTPLELGAGEALGPGLDPTVTREGVVMGTPNYMSPEQFRGDALDARSDQFSFCAALYLALYNARPFDPGEMSRAVSGRGSTRTAPAPERPEVKLEPSALIHEPPREAKVPAWVRRVVMRGLSFEPAERFESMEALLTALSPEPRLARRRWLGMGALAGTMLVVVSGAAMWRARVCTGAERRMAQVWGPAERQRVSTAFQQAAGAPGEDLFRRASALLDTYATAWAKQSTEACEATRLRSERTELLLSQQVACLDRERESVRALVKVLGEVDAKGVQKSLDAVYALPSPADCANLTALSEQQPRPADPTRRAELTRLETEVAGVKALLDVSRYPAALEAAQKLEPQVAATGYLPLVAELGFHQGWLQSLLGQTEVGAQRLEQAIYEAEEGRVDRLQVSILNKLLFVAGQQEHYDEAERWGRLGEATVRRTGGDAVLESDLLTNRANLALWKEQPQEARKLLERARTLLGALPEGHPKRARVTYALGRALLDLGELPTAVAMLDEALRRMEAAVGPQHLELGRFHGELSRALRENGDPTRALEHARAAVALYRASAGDPLLQADSLDSEGMCLLALKRHEEALSAFREALGLKQQHLEADDSELQYSYDGVGQALLGLGRTREAVDSLRRASGFSDVPEKVLGDTGFVLANALWREGQDQEARVEAVRALERFTQAGDTKRADEVKSWMKVLEPEPELKPRPAVRRLKPRRQ